MCDRELLVHQATKGYLKIEEVRNHTRSISLYSIDPLELQTNLQDRSQPLEVCLTWWRQVWNLIGAILWSRHSWLSIYGRYACSTVTCIDRVAILYSSLLVSSVLSAVFVEAQVEGSDSQVAAWLYCGLITIFISTLQYQVFFPFDNTRFHHLFMYAAENAMLVRLGGKQRLDQGVDKDKLMAHLLHYKFHHKPGCFQWYTNLKLLLMSYKYENDFAPVDFRLSRSPELRQQSGLQLVMDDLQMSMEALQALWQTGNFRKHRHFGYFFSISLAFLCQVVLLTYMLQFQLADDVSAVREEWVSNWWRGMVAEILFSPLVLLSQYAIFLLAWRLTMPDSSDFDDLLKLHNEAHRIHKLHRRSTGQALELTNILTTINPSPADKRASQAKVPYSPVTLGRVPARFDSHSSSEPDAFSTGISICDALRAEHESNHSGSDNDRDLGDSSSKKQISRRVSSALDKTSRANSRIIRASLHPRIARSARRSTRSQESSRSPRRSTRASVKLGSRRVSSRSSPRESSMSRPKRRTLLKRPTLKPREENRKSGSSTQQSHNPSNAFAYDPNRGKPTFLKQHFYKPYIS